MDYDIFLISFPKAGRTWLTLMMGRSIQQHFGLRNANPIRLRKMCERFAQVPSIRLAHDDRPQWKRPENLATSREEYRGKKVIFMVRDPRDLLISNYFQKKKRAQSSKVLFFFTKKNREGQEPFQGELADFLHAEVGGFDTILAYHNIWAANRDVPAGFLLVRYEDLKADPAGGLRKVLDFIGLPDVSGDVVREAAEFASFDNMRRMEQTDALGSHRLRARNANDGDSYKVRKGKVGGYVDYLTPEQIEFLNEKMRATLTDFYGYRPNISTAGPARSQE